jgi:hypothetical protein
VPNKPDDPTAWFGRSESGAIYRYSPDSAGTAHFSGKVSSSDPRNFTPYARRRLGQ